MATQKIESRNFLGFPVYAEYKTEPTGEGTEKLLTRNTHNEAWILNFILLDEKSAAAVGDVVIKRILEEII